jgi:hypothetical protein
LPTGHLGEFPRSTTQSSSWAFRGNSPTLSWVPVVVVVVVAVQVVVAYG